MRRGRPVLAAALLLLLGASLATPLAAQEQPSAPIVLVAEDDPNARELLTQYISSAGYVVRHASDGEQAVSMAHEIRPSAITLDIMLPKKDGWKVLSELKSHPETRAIPVVIVSITHDRQLGFSLGATDFLLKPVLPEELKAHAERLLASSAAAAHSSAHGARPIEEALGATAC